LNVVTDWFRDTITIDVPSGKYKAEWINPASGTVMKSYDIESENGSLLLDTPLYLCDIALIMTGI
jgi:hypothetical protein